MNLLTILLILYIILAIVGITYFIYNIICLKRNTNKYKDLYNVEKKKVNLYKEYFEYICRKK